MARINLGLDRQISFFRQLSRKSGLSSDDLGKKVGISGRSFRDWMNGKTLPKKKYLMALSKEFQISIPSMYEIREEHWSGRVNGHKAALKAIELYGSPGTAAGRAKGGAVSQERRRVNPAYYRSLGCNVRNDFTFPDRSADLAEFVGIILGDGGMTQAQCQITLHLHDDERYSKHVQQLIEKLFAYKANILLYPNKTARELVITGSNFIAGLMQLGLQVGNKVKNQVMIPDWIKNNQLWYTSCIRGLFDTDGGTYSHHHRTKGYSYIHFGISFTSASVPLREDFRQFLRMNDIKCGLSGLNVLVYNKPGIKRFFALVDPHNLKHWDRYRHYMGA